jgi:Cu-processing system permease protein
MTAITVFRYELQDLRRSRWVMGYALCLLLLTEALLRFAGGGPRAVLSLMNVVLAVVPLVSVVFGTMYLYGSRNFIELLLAQPVGRGSLFVGLYAGLAVPLAAGFLLGVGLPFVWDGAGEGPLAGPLLLLRLDTAALMGYTGAVFERFFGSLLGMVLTIGALLLWCAGPLLAARQRFCRKDF